MEDSQAKKQAPQTTSAINIAEGAVAERLRKLIAEDESTTALSAFGLERFVPENEVNFVVDSVERAFEVLETVETELSDGSRILVTNLAVPFVVDERPHYIRFLKYIEGKKKLSKATYLVFDMTASTDHVLVRNPHLFRIDSDKDSLRGTLVEDSKGGMPAFNDINDVSFVQEVLVRFYEESEELDRLRDQELEQNQVTQETEAEKKRSLRRSRRERARRGLKEGATILAKSALALAVTGGLSFGAINNHEVTDLFDGRARFDKKEIVIEGGSEISVGELGHPEFSFELLNDDQLEWVDVPEVGNLKDSPHRDDTREYQVDEDDANSMTTESNEIARNSYRQVVILSGSDDESVETTFVNLESPDDKLLAWTDSHNPEEISVTLDVDGEVRVGRRGPRGDEKLEDVRVVLRHVPASNRASD